MRSFLKFLAGGSVLGMLTSIAFAQETIPRQQDPVANAEVKTDVIQPTPKNTVTKEQMQKKMIQDATINLQTTITGNQEQPRVLYILPWQSPQTENVDFEPLDNQQKAVFGHIEREELRRELESAGELQ